MKLLVCVFPFGDFMVGDTAKVTDAEAEVQLLQMNGRYRVWEMQKDLGPDAAPAPEAKAEPKPEAEVVVEEEPALEAPAIEPAAELAEEAELSPEALEEVAAPRRGRKPSK